MRTGHSFSLRRRAAALAVVLSCLAMAGCSWFEPPAEVLEQADALAEEVREMDGVADLTINTFSRDIKDHPNDWVIHLDVTATNSDQLAVLPAPILEAASRPTVYAVNISLTIPATISRAEVSLYDLRPEAVAAAEAIRALPQIKSANLSSGPSGTWVELKSSAKLRDTADALRTVPGFGVAEQLGTVTINWRGDTPDAIRSVEIGQSGPAPAVIDLLERLGDDQSVARVSASENDVDQKIGGPYQQRSRVSVRATDQDAVIAALTSVRDEAAEAGTRPRTSFTVSDANSTTDGFEPDGFVGLPLGSPEPDDLPEPPPPPPGTVLPGGEVVPPLPWAPDQDPAVREELATRAADVTALFAAAEQAAGVAGEHKLDEVPCDDTNQGSRMSGWTVVPIFQEADRADDAFEAIVAGWEETGLTYSDRALGLDIYANRAEGAAITQATIRGTGEGINISVKSACVL